MSAPPRLAAPARRQRTAGSGTPRPRRCGLAQMGISRGCINPASRAHPGRWTNAAAGWHRSRRASSSGTAQRRYGRCGHCRATRRQRPVAAGLRARRHSRTAQAARVTACQDQAHTREREGGRHQDVDGRPGLRVRGARLRIRLRQQALAVRGQHRQDDEQVRGGEGGHQWPAKGPEHLAVAQRRQQRDQPRQDPKAQQQRKTRVQHHVDLLGRTVSHSLTRYGSSTRCRNLFEADYSAVPAKNSPGVVTPARPDSYRMGL